MEKVPNAALLGSDSGTGRGQPSCLCALSESDLAGRGVDSPKLWFAPLSGERIHTCTSLQGRDAVKGNVKREHLRLLLETMSFRGHLLGREVHAP